ncbi:hypothetical protein GWC77_27545, partial [Paraburkholderia sp. NMBU_R16]|nr:hypothetical protein [Paraburkholderia sp. NMBU_R16]
GGGSQALHTVRDLSAALRAPALGYSKDDIVRIAANSGGSQALRALHEHHAALTGLGYTKEAIMPLASQPRGAAGALKRAAGVV